MEFLSVVASDLLKKAGKDLSDTIIVFPNKRASLFFNKALVEQCKEPIWSPQYTTISELFRQCTDMTVADRIKLVCDLHKAYVEVTGSDEPLDQFYGWGELMLADFDDVDKHMADASKVFTLIGDVHKMDAVDYLTDKQKEIIKRFFKNFSTDHNSILKQRFLKLWSKFGEIYDHYRNTLISQNIAYEGMLYRKVVEALQSDENGTCPFEGKRYVFVGFNLLNDVEQGLFTYIMNNRTALFYWDFDDYYMHGGEAGRYISQYLRQFHNALDYDHPAYDNMQKDKDITYISAPTEDIQARYIAQWLTPERIKAGRKTAIVLADEALLETVLHCLPKELKSVNITTGFPLAKAPVASLLRLVIALYRHKSPTLHGVNPILRHPYMKYLSENAVSLHERLNTDKIFYPTKSDLYVDENLTTLFSPITGDIFCNALSDRLLWLIKTIAVNADGDDFMTESLFRAYTLINRLKQTLSEQVQLEDNLSFYTRLLQQIIQSTTIPFHGEPIEGIQIMGVLETRNLDFDHLLLLSCNEVNLPASINDSSFIPHSIRKAYELTTIDNKVAIYAYYFHRLLQRCGDIQITYNNSTTDGKTGEISRFMLQLLAESRLNIKRMSLEASQEPSMPTERKTVEKTDEMVGNMLERRYFSPSALGKYLRCPLSFYYYYIEGIKNEEDSDEEEMDGRTFGNVFHRAAELLYKSMENRTVTVDYIRGLLEEKGHVTIKRFVDEAFRLELFNIKDEKRPTPQLGGLELINREMVIEFILNLLQYDRKHAPFTILGLEKPVYDEIKVKVGKEEKTFRIGGTIDRMDRLAKDGTDSVIRIIDYKTGKYTPLSMESVENIFDSAFIAKHSDYYLQALMYSGIIDNEQKKDGKNNRISPSLMYVKQAAHEDYSPTLSIAKEEIDDAAIYLPEFWEHLRTLIGEILDTDKPFSPTEDKKRCTGCIFHPLCY